MIELVIFLCRTQLDPSSYSGYVQYFFPLTNIDISISLNNRMCCSVLFPLPNILILLKLILNALI